ECVVLVLMSCLLFLIFSFFSSTGRHRISKRDWSSDVCSSDLEFVREIREAIKDQLVEEKVDVFKHADVLMLDVIGAETQSAWFRDDILGSILQYRMMEQLPVFFTSNYTMKQLEERLAETTRGGIEQVKAGRIM